jgi:hypothetical protein
MLTGLRSEASSVDSESLSKSQTALDLWKPERRLGDKVWLTCPTSEVTGKLLVPQRCLTSERIRQAFNLPNTPDIILEFTTTPGGWVECVFVEHQGPSQSEILVSSNGVYSVLAVLGDPEGKHVVVLVSITLSNNYPDVTFSQNRSGSPAHESKHEADAGQGSITLEFESKTMVVPRRKITSRSIQQMFALGHSHDIILEVLESNGDDESDVGVSTGEYIFVDARGPDNEADRKLLQNTTACKILVDLGDSEGAL